MTLAVLSLMVFHPDWPTYSDRRLDHYFLIFLPSAPGIILICFAINMLASSAGKRNKAVPNTGRPRIVSYTFALLWVTVALYLLAALAPLAAMRTSHRTTREGERYRNCYHNLRLFGLIFNMYANENEEMFPPIDDYKNNFIFDGTLLYPEYLSDISLLICGNLSDYREGVARLQSSKYHPNANVGTTHPDCITDRCYIYLGWMVTSDEEAEAFFEAYDELLPDEYGKDITVPEGKGNAGGNAINRLWYGVDRFLITDVNAVFTGEEMGSSVIPVMWDRPYTDPSKFSHQDNVTNDPAGIVLYLDGHVELVKYGEKFPMTETMARLLEERPREPIPDCEEFAGDDHES